MNIKICTVEKKSLFAIIVSSLFVALFVLMLGCDDEKTVTEPVAKTVEGSLIGVMGCKTPEQFETPAFTPQDQECLEYLYDGVSVLQLRHVNANFNCCLDSANPVGIEISIDGNVIAIEETEHLYGGGCDCLCLYDLGYEITNLSPGVYTVRITADDSYYGDNHEVMECTLDLTEETEDSYCVDRYEYPWESGTPQGVLTQYEGCKPFVSTTALSDLIAPNQECLVYLYDGDSVLQIEHINAGFNCCPGDITTEINVDGNVITIADFESTQGCRCVCLFDLSYEIGDLLPGRYTIYVTGPYMHEQWSQDVRDTIEFQVDLFSEISDSYCVERNHDPWYELEF